MRIPYGYILKGDQLTINKKQRIPCTKYSAITSQVQALEKLRIGFSLVGSPPQQEIPNGQGPPSTNFYPTQNMSLWLDLSFIQMFSLKRSAGAI